MMRWLLAALLLIGTAQAQQTEAERICAVIEAQRNQALTWHAQSQARVNELNDQVAELKKKLEAAGVK